MKNLFDYATKELSQDAFLMWLFDNLNKDTEIDDDLKEASIGLLNKFGIPVTYDDIEWVWTKGQWCKMDISVHIKTKEKKYALYIEDKTYSHENNQLKRYNTSIDRISKDCDKVFKIYYKTSLMEEEEKRQWRKHTGQNINLMR